MFCKGSTKAQFQANIIWCILPVGCKITSLTPQVSRFTTYKQTRGQSGSFFKSNRAIVVFLCSLISLPFLINTNTRQESLPNCSIIHYYTCILVTFVTGRHRLISLCFDRERERSVIITYTARYITHSEQDKSRSAL